MKAGIVLDDWKLPVFRKALTEGGYAYEDKGEATIGTTLLHVEFTDPEHLRRVVEGAADECKRQGKPKP